MTTTDLRPRSATEIVDTALRIARRHYARLVTLSVVVMLPYMVVALANLKLLVPQTVQGVVRQPMLSVRTGVVALTQLVVFVLTEAVLVRAASDAYLKERVSAGSVLSAALGRIPSILLGGILRALVVGGTFIPTAFVFVVVMPFIDGRNQTLSIVALIAQVTLALSALAYASVRTFAITPAIVLEGCGAMTALRRSMRLTRNNTAHAFGALLLAFLIYLAMVACSATVGTVFDQPRAAVALQTVVIACTFPVLACVATVLYYDLRVRSEGLDLELMIGEAAPQTSAH